jgi:phosphoglucan,water dikinase
MFLQLELIRGLLSKSVDDQSRLEALTYSAIYLKVFSLAPDCKINKNTGDFFI